MDAVDRMAEAHLPPKEKFYSNLNEEHISDADYAHTLKVWETFQFKTMGEYNNLYLSTDVVLLAEAFQPFRLVTAG